MLKKLLSLSFVLVTYDASAATDLDLYQAPLSSLNQFSFKQQTPVRTHASAPTAEKIPCKQSIKRKSMPKPS